jgi:sugar O-acyltransferase (sialic acid O-acetyltransferase NeuD family)
MNEAHAEIPPQLGETQRPHCELYLAGSGSFAVEVAEWAQDAGWTVTGLIELLDTSRIGSVLEGHPIIDPAAPSRDARAAVAIGGDRRSHWAMLGQHGWQAATIVHPRAHVSSSAKLGEGCILGPGAVIGAETVIDGHALVSRGVLVGHHARIGAYVSLMPGVNLGGHVKLGDRATIGMGAVIVNGTRVGVEATVAAGAVVLEEVADNVRVQGIPAKEYRG